MKLIITILLTALLVQVAPQQKQVRIANQPKQAKVEVRVEAKSKPVTASKPKAEVPTTNVVKPVSVAPARPQAAYVAVGSSSEAKAFIYQKESGNNPAAINKSSGACGLGQALPCSKMPCSLSDYACQDQFFTSYMQNRYGSWENAKAFWLSHKWW